MAESGFAPLRYNNYTRKIFLFRYTSVATNLHKIAIFEEGLSAIW